MQAHAVPVHGVAVGRPFAAQPQPIVRTVIPGVAVAAPVQAPVDSVPIPNHFRLIRQLGRGAFGTVHLAEDTRSGVQVAVKHVKGAVRQGKCMLREIRLLARLHHENLLHLLDFCAPPGPDFEDVVLVLPYMFSDLHKVIQSRQAFTEKHLQVITVQILRGLGYLHAAGVAHRDLKPANILCSADCKIKVCDFGLARGDMQVCGLDKEEPAEAFGILTEYVVTRWYRAPEVMLLPKQYTSSVDLWSVGCILGEMLSRKPIFPGGNHIEMICRVAQMLGTPTDTELDWLPKESDAFRFLNKVVRQSLGPPTPLSAMFPSASAECLDLLRMLLQWDPHKRFTAKQAQEHPYLKTFLPKEPQTEPEPFDWTFDGFKATPEAMKEKLWAECARFHPEILERGRLRWKAPQGPAAPTTVSTLRPGTAGA